ncbi:hypothetical protein ACJJTC_012646 [Scirpophaga incertulas]
MRAFIVLVLSLAAFVAAAPKNPQRIVGGNITTIDHYPEMVMLMWSRTGNPFKQICGGCILNKRAFLTAAHCIVKDSPLNWHGRVGSSFAHSGGVLYASSKLIPHKQYNGKTMDNDIGIIRTASAISFGDSIQPAKIADANYILGDNEVVYAAGWGTTSPGGSPSEQLQDVQIWTVNQTICEQRYSTVGSNVTDNMLCSGYLDVGGRDQCQGDSGGPLYHNGVVVGVASWGRSCGLASFPGVNTRVSRYASWIKSNE